MREPTFAIFGGDGQLGQCLVKRARESGFSYRAFGRKEANVENAEAVNAAVLDAAPDVIINAAAYTAVDNAETEPARAFSVNRDGAANLAAVCATIGVPLIQISTDYVFDGRKAAPYSEDDVAHPLNVYGASKLAGEQAIRVRLAHHVILRTSWVFSPIRHNFVRTMLRLGPERETLDIVDDQIGSPTYAIDLADACLEVGRELVVRPRTDSFGTFHFCGLGATSWFSFAETIYELLRLPISPTLRPVSTAMFSSEADRPRDSRLDCSRIAKVFGIEARPWRDGLIECLDELLNTDKIKRREK